MANNTSNLVFAGFVVFTEALFVLLFGLLTEYSDTAQEAGDRITAAAEVDHYYPLFQDVHVMIFIGFGFLMTFLKKYGYGSVGFNFMLSAFVIQWAMIVNGCFHAVYASSSTDCTDPLRYHTDKSLEACSDVNSAQDGLTLSSEQCKNALLLKYANAHPFHGCEWHRITLGITDLIKSDFAAGAVMISFGACLGKASPLQLIVMAFFEIVFYAINETIGALYLGAVDMGGSIFVHTFGAYFGLAVSLVATRKRGSHDDTHPDNGPDKKSDMFAMIGTIFLWMFWPSFNGALALETQQHRVIVNTVLALSACCLSAFAFSAVFRPERKFDMVDIQNATLAGGVAVGSSADLVIQPYGALIVGLVAGLLSVVGYVYVQPCLAKTIGLDDTCGVHNLHGMPGIMGALGGTISAAIAGDQAGQLYGSSVGKVFPARCGKWFKEEAAAQLQLQLANSGSEFAAGGLTGQQLYDFVDSRGAKVTGLTGSLADRMLVDKEFNKNVTTWISNSISAATNCDAPGEGRSAGDQGAIQLGAVATCWAIAIVGGIITGLIMKLFEKVPGHAGYERWYNDADYWETPDEEEEEGAPAKEMAAVNPDAMGV